MSLGINSGATYRLVNAKAGNVADLSGGDNTSVIGFDWHGGDNQKWRLHDQGQNVWYIENVATGKYLYINGAAQDGTAIIASSDGRTGFNIWRDDNDQSVYRIFVPHTTFNFDLSDHGNAKPGTPITLWGRWEGRHQCWRIEQV